jgi:hypothetical protein
MISAHNKYCADKFTDEQINALASFCKEQNPAFMRDRWLSYIKGECGKNGGTIKKAA